MRVLQLHTAPGDLQPDAGADSGQDCHGRNGRMARMKTEGAADPVKEVVPAENMKQRPAQKNVDNAAGPSFQQHSGPGTQKSLNPAKNQPKTMRHLR